MTLGVLGCVSGSAPEGEERDIVLRSGEGGSLALLAGELGGPGYRDGRGSDARIFWPAAFALSARGELFVADALNGAIRSVDLPTGEMKTLVSAHLNSNPENWFRPVGLALDGGEYLYVANHFGSIDRVHLGSGVRERFVGDPLERGHTNGKGARFNGPTGIAYHEGALVVSDTENHVLRRVDLETGEVTTPYGAPGEPGEADGAFGDARFRSPGAVVSDGSGNLFVCDTENHAIRRVDTRTGEVTTLVKGAPGEEGALSLPMGMWREESGDLLVYDARDSTIRRVTVRDARVVALPWGPGNASTLEGLATHFTGTETIRLPVAIAVGPGGYLYAADVSRVAVTRIHMTSGVATPVLGRGMFLGDRDGSREKARFLSPQGALGDGRGTLFVSDVRRIRKIDEETGRVTTVAGVAGEPGCEDGASPRFRDVRGLSWTLAGELLVADRGCGAVRRVNTKSGATLTLASGLSQPEWISVRGNEAFITDRDRVWRLVLSRGEISVLSRGFLVHASGIAAGEGDNVFVGDGPALRRIDARSGEVSLVAGAPFESGFIDAVGRDARFAWISGVHFADDGVLYVADATNGAVRRFDPQSGKVTTLLGTPPIRAVTLGPLPASLNVVSDIAPLGGGRFAIVGPTEGAVLLARLPAE